MGAREPYYQYALSGVEELVLNTGDRQGLSAAHRMMLMKAARRARRDYGEVIAPMTALWMNCLEQGRVPDGVLRRPDAWMAGLLYGCLRRAGRQTDMEEIARMYRVPKRQAQRCVRRLGLSVDETEGAGQPRPDEG